MTIGKRIAYYRNIRDITQKELANKLGISEEIIQAYEANEKEVSLEMGNKLADVLNIPLTRLTEKEEIQKRPLSNFLEEEKETPMPESFTTFLKQKTTSRYRFLITDDFYIARHQLRSILEKNYDCDIVEAENGIEAVLMYQQALSKGKTFDLIFVDAIMPKLDGVSALTYLQALDKDSKVIMTTALAGELLVKDCLFKGARHFILKHSPFNPYVDEKIKDVVNKVLHK